MAFSHPFITTPVPLTGGWDAVLASSPARHVAILADAVGVGLLWSTNAAPAAGEGVPFSLAGAPGSYEFKAPTAANALYVKGPAGSVCTVVVG